jgi:hypothetical protein
MNEGGRGQSGNGRIFGNEVDEANQEVRNADHPARPRKKHFAFTYFDWV